MRFNNSMIKSISHLKYPPIKNTIKKIPQNIIYLWKQNEEYYLAKVTSTKFPSSKGMMHFKKSQHFHFYDDKPTLHILLLRSQPRKIGLGTSMLNFAKNFSKQIGCEGRISLIAEPELEPFDIAHTFYRKHGMTTMDSETDAQLDKFIQEKRPATIYNFPRLNMYYSPNNINNKTTDIKNIDIKNRFLGYFKKIFNIF